MKLFPYALVAVMLLAACGEKDDNGTSNNIKSGNALPNSSMNNGTTGSNNGTTGTNNTNGATNGATNGGTNSGTNQSTNNVTAPPNAATNADPGPAPFSYTIEGDAVMPRDVTDVTTNFDGFATYIITGRADTGAVLTLVVEADGPGTFACAMDTFVPTIDYNESSAGDAIWSSAGSDCSFEVTEASGTGGKFTASFSGTLLPVDNAANMPRMISGDVDVPVE